MGRPFEAGWARLRLAAWVLAAATALPLAAEGRALPEDAVRGLRQAEEAYREGRYGEALEIYRSLAREGLGGWALDYNAGNAALRAGEPGWAVYHYERALRQNPRHPDIRHNYAFLRSALGLEGASPGQGGPRFLRWAGRLAGAFTLGDALRALLIFYWLAAALGILGLLRIGTGSRVRAPLKLAAAALLVAALAAGFKLWEHGHRPDAVLVEAVGIRSAPQADVQQVAELSEGTLVHRLRRIGDWCEVEVGEGIRGWVSREALQAL